MSETVLMGLPILWNDSRRGDKYVHQMAFAATIFAAAFFCSGCDFSEPVEPTESRIRVLADEYMRFCNQHAGKGPKNEAEFKSFLEEKAGEEALKRAGVETIDELFVSERDEKPLVVLYGKDTIWRDFLEIVVHETEGRHGQVMVGYRVGDAELITADALAEARKAKR